MRVKRELREVLIDNNKELLVCLPDNLMDQISIQKKLKSFGWNIQKEKLIKY